MAEIAQLLEEVRQLREEVKTGQEETSRKLARSGRKESYSFKRKANEMQHRFNEEVADKLEEAGSGRQLIAHRQKLLKLADHSEYGWSLVEQYEEDALADDSEDEKRIDKAERAAERKVQAKRRKEAADERKRVPNGREAVQREVPRPRPEERPYKPSMFAPGICFQCGGMGHLRRDCPKRVPLSAEYPLLEYEHVSDTCLGVDSGNVTPVEGGVDRENVTPVEGSIESVRCWELQTADSGMPEVGQLSAQLESEFVSKAVVELLAGGYVERSSEPPTVCSPLSVVVSGAGKKRLVVNLRHVNQYLWKQKFKYEDLRVAMTMFSKEPEWIPREQNEIADYISRIVDYDDWYVNPAVFAWVEELWGPHTVDRFASHYNMQLPRFNSRFASPGAEAVDAFTVNWSGENNWWCPPPVLIPRVLRHAEGCRALGTLVVPCWESAPYWPLLCP
eukprot:Em0011g578a